MKYVIMADGRERRWGGYHGIHKWQIKIGNENLLERTSRLIRQLDPEGRIYITSHDTQLHVAGTTRYEPENNRMEIDRFTAELIERDTCFLYGDVYYTEESLRKIISCATDSVLFFGNREKIFGVKVTDDACFRQHIAQVKERYLKNEIRECIGWEVYQSLQGLPLESRVIAGGFVMIEDETRDFNAPDDLKDGLVSME